MCVSVTDVDTAAGGMGERNGWREANRRERENPDGRFKAMNTLLESGSWNEF